MCASKTRGERAKQRAKLRQRQLEEGAKLRQRQLEGGAKMGRRQLERGAKLRQRQQEGGAKMGQRQLERGAKLRQRQLEGGAKMEPKGKKRKHQGGKGTTQGRAGGEGTRKKRRLQEREGTTSGPAYLLREPRQESLSHKDYNILTLERTEGPADPSQAVPSGEDFDMLTPERTEGPAGPGQAGPSDEDYNIPTSERTELLTNLKSLLEVDLVSPTFWACCQLSDIKILKGLVDTAKINPSFVLGYDTPVSVVPRLWTQKFKELEGSESGQFSGSKKTKETYRTTNNSDGKKWVSRLDSAKDRCIERDNGECVLTKANEPQATHIFPYSMLNKTANTSHARYTAQSSFWSLLKVFWDKDRVDKWRKKIFPDPQHPDTGVDSCFNLICLTATAHGYWNNGHFALKPLKLSEDEKELTIQFFWQPQYDHKLTDNVDLLMESVSSKDLDLVEKEEKKCFLTRISDDLSTPKIKSGDIFTLTTDDPGRRPLPSLELLEMQWILQRITAMSGAAGTPEIDWSDDGDTNSRPTLIPDDNNGDIRSYSDRVYKWIPRPSLPGSVLSMA